MCSERFGQFSSTSDRLSERPREASARTACVRNAKDASPFRRGAGASRLAVEEALFALLHAEAGALDGGLDALEEGRVDEGGVGVDAGEDEGLGDERVLVRGVGAVALGVREPLGLGSTRVIQRRFNVSVPRARVPGKASTLRDRSKR